MQSISESTSTSDTAFFARSIPPTASSRGGASTTAPRNFFIDLVKRHPGCRVVFETTMNWAWLYELLEPHIAQKDIILADAFKTRIIAESQVKNDKVDAKIPARLLRAGKAIGVRN